MNSLTAAEFYKILYSYPELVATIISTIIIYCII